MGRLDPTYSPEHKAELIRLVEIIGLPIKDAVGMLAAGSNGVEPVVMNYESARKYLSDHRANHRKATAQTRDHDVELLLAEMFTVVSSQVARAAQADREGDPLPPREVATILANVQVYAKQSQTNAPKGEQSKADNAVASLTKQLQHRAKRQTGQRVQQPA